MPSTDGFGSPSWAFAKRRCTKKARMSSCTETPVSPARTGLRYNLLAGLLAFSVWGGWAFYVNSTAGLATALVSGLAQGIASFATVLAMIASVTWLSERLGSVALKILAPPVITVGVAGSCIAAIHYLIGTPNIAKTVLPFVVVASGFCLFTAVKLHRARASRS